MDGGRRVITYRLLLRKAVTRHVVLGGLFIHMVTLPPWEACPHELFLHDEYAFTSTSRLSCLCFGLIVFRVDNIPR
jgi:hypothetical protein